MEKETEEFLELKAKAEEMDININECLKNYSVECLKRLIALKEEEQLKESLLDIANLHKKSSNRKLRNR
ncbi:hypothetical protein PJV92_11580 [Aliarcobacter butzleri]|uniref:Uncharacterized protein n=1 Tax=Aliarcobacter butzleri TaxID=28197 RepID=A0AAP4Q0M9_9BACT|nr:hypothetical protein [Aliarcobacter butzleri]MDN5051358.1 hypothetical protein [Aliarcobacter butzleri]MDN5074211.1 hypothetical protein [Aliarcobacter butzleri]MDN5115628.1 hypothetical protein [Aliarcobacter butzleri]MDN5133360.1 hypothetical protein [Aliarcobacter butzleri]